MDSPPVNGLAKIVFGNFSNKDPSGGTKSNEKFSGSASATVTDEVGAAEQIVDSPTTRIEIVVDFIIGLQCLVNN